PFPHFLAGKTRRRRESAPRRGSAEGVSQPSGELRVALQEIVGNDARILSDPERDRQLAGLALRRRHALDANGGQTRLGEIVLNLVGREAESTMRKLGAQELLVAG